MTLLVLGVALFAIVHLIPAVPSLKARIKEAVGNKAYGPAFGVASIITLLMIIFGWRMADFVPVYDPPEWGRHANFGFTLIAFLCLGIFLFRGSFRQTLRFPLAIGVLFWGTGHLLANGDERSVILFGGLMIYAALHIVLGLANGVRPSPEVRGGHDLLSLVAGVALYGLMTQLHTVLIGVPVIQLS